MSAPTRTALENAILVGTLVVGSALVLLGVFGGGPRPAPATAVRPTATLATSAAGTPVPTPAQSPVGTPVPTPTRAPVATSTPVPTSSQPAGATSSPSATPTQAPVATSTPAPTPSTAPAGPVAIVIETVSGADEFRYAQETVQAPPGTRIKLEFVNRTDPADEVGHNWVLVKPGQEESVLASATAAGDDSDWLDANDPGIIAATRLIEGGQKDSITFDAPAPGTYTFVCTFPDHYKGGMKGTLTIP